jgi:hypothetical protein
MTNKEECDVTAIVWTHWSHLASLSKWTSNLNVILTSFFGRFCCFATSKGKRALTRRLPLEQRHLPPRRSVRAPKKERPRLQRPIPPVEVHLAVEPRCSLSCGSACFKAWCATRCTPFRRRSRRSPEEGTVVPSVLRQVPHRRLCLSHRKSKVRNL